MVMSMRSEHVDRMSIGEFARDSRLSAKALRLYDELGLLPPARVDEDSGYRLYEPGQLKQARLIAALRQLVLESLHVWGEERGVEPNNDLGIRITYLASLPLVLERQRRVLRVSGDYREVL